MPLNLVEVTNVYTVLADLMETRITTLYNNDSIDAETYSKLVGSMHMDLSKLSVDVVQKQSTIELNDDILVQKSINEALNSDLINAKIKEVYDGITRADAKQDDNELTSATNRDLVSKQGKLTERQELAFSDNKDQKLLEVLMNSISILKEVAPEQVAIPTPLLTSEGMDEFIRRVAFRREPGDPQYNTRPLASTLRKYFAEPIEITIGKRIVFDVIQPISPEIGVSLDYDGTIVRMDFLYPDSGVDGQIKTSSDQGVWSYNAVHEWVEYIATNITSNDISSTSNTITTTSNVETVTLVSSVGVPTAEGDGESVTDGPITSTNELSNAIVPISDNSTTVGNIITRIVVLEQTIVTEYFFQRTAITIFDGTTLTVIEDVVDTVTTVDTITITDVIEATYPSVVYYTVTDNNGLISKPALLGFTSVNPSV